MPRSRRAYQYRYLIKDTPSSGTKTPRLYYREPGMPRVRLQVDEHHPDLLAHYEAAKAGTPLPKPDAAPVRVKRDTTKPGTLAALVRSYAASAKFQQIKEAGRKPILSILESCCAEKWTSGALIGNMDAKRIEARHVQILQDKKAGLPGAANNRVKYLRILFGWARIDPNPAKHVDMLKPVRKDGHRMWTDQDVAAYEATHAVGTKARLALDIALYTSARRGDIAQLGPDNLFMKDGKPWLTFTQGKTGNVVAMPLMAPLARSIYATPGCEDAFLTTHRGKPYTAAGLGNAFQEWRTAAGLPKGTALHGLRKTSASRLAELGATENEIQAITGHTTSKQVEVYTKLANRKTMAMSAMAKLAASLTPVLLLEDKRG